jgi:environmental stress-induced protein Ves
VSTSDPTAPGSGCLNDLKSTLHTARLQDAIRQPWRNGGGVTHELLAWAPERAAGAHPAGNAQHTNWVVRVSVADITQDGPFSAFPGIDRCFTVLQGAGVVLTLRGADLHLTPDSEPLAFDGADAPGCRLISGATRDLNLMVRQSTGRAWIQRAVAGQAWDTAAVNGEKSAGVQTSGSKGTDPQHPHERWLWRGLYTHGPACLNTPGGRIVLHEATLLWSGAGADGEAEDAMTAPWCLIEGSQAWWLGLHSSGLEDDRT